MTDEKKAHKLSDYEEIVGKDRVDELRMLAEKLRGRKVQQINSTRKGGGVAEILTQAVPLFCEMGVETRWDVITGTNDFFTVTKKFHNALHGRKERITGKDIKVYEKTSEENIRKTDFWGDIMFIHDPQPALLIKKKKAFEAKWIWRCHIDVSRPDKKIWSYLKQTVRQYDAAVFSAPQFSQKLSIRQFLIYPSIDPLAPKNRDIPEKEIDRVFSKYGIDRQKPAVTQVSRYDYLKDPAGVIKAYRLAKKYIDCQLILAGNRAADDPESEKVLAEVKQEAGGDKDIHILLIPPEENDLDINALQRGSTVILQKSLREGFALTVTEALWKSKPVIGSAVGGIPLQIKHNYSGLLSHTIEGAAHYIKQVLQNPDFAKRLGENGRAHVRNNFLLTRHLRDYMLLFLSLYHREDVVNL